MCASERESGVYVLENSLGDELKVAIKNKLSTALYRQAHQGDPDAARSRDDIISNCAAQRDPINVNSWM
jgi:hypothetical protein